MPYTQAAQGSLRPAHRLSGLFGSFDFRVRLIPIAFAMLVPSYGAQAQQAASSNISGTTPPRGEIIVLRDVPMRPAQAKGEPGVPVVVQTDKSATIIDALTMGLKPITDSEAGGISGDNGALNGVGGLVRDALQPERLGDASSAFGGQNNPSTMGLGTGSIGAALGQGLSAIGGAMTAVRTALPNGGN